MRGIHADVIDVYVGMSACLHNQLVIQMVTSLLGNMNSYVACFAAVTGPGGGVLLVDCSVSCFFVLQ